MLKNATIKRLAQGHEIQDQPDAGVGNCGIEKAKGGTEEVDDDTQRLFPEFKIQKPKLHPSFTNRFYVLQGSENEILPYQKKHLVTSLLPNTGLETTRSCFFGSCTLHRCTVGSQWSDHSLLGVVLVQRLETWTAFDPGSSPRK